MHLQPLAQTLLVLAIVQCSAAPHFLMVLDNRNPSVKDIHGHHVPLHMFSAPKEIILRDAAPDPPFGSDDIATVVYSTSATASASIEEIESSEDPPFHRRDMASVVAQNMPTLMKAKSSSGIPGYKSFAEAVTATLDEGKRDLAKLFKRGAQTKSDPECGGRYSCIKKRQAPSGSGNPQCGGWYSCIKKRLSSKAPASPEGGGGVTCGGWYSCIKERVFPRGPSAQGTEGTTCGGRFSCIKKRLINSIRVLVSRKSKAASQIASSPIFNWCHNGLCIDAKSSE